MKRLLYSKQPLDDSLNKQIDLKDLSYKEKLLFDMDEPVDDLLNTKLKI